ncbi:MAG: hypothetical protein IJU44_04595 [Kiritimatiellae bacterium]|nr:hypothetical protein [Kiritimatiellia bacterium]
MEARERQEKAIKLLCHWYDSYRSSPYSSARVLNPVAVGKALPNGILMNYWSKTGPFTDAEHFWHRESTDGTQALFLL